MIGCDAVRFAHEFLEKARLYLRSVVSADGTGNRMAKVIQFYVPASFRSRGVPVPLDQRGKVIEFPSPQRIDGMREQHKQRIEKQLNNGDVVIERLTTTESDSSTIKTPGALVHHWIGTAFIPAATVQGSRLGAGL